MAQRGLTSLKKKWQPTVAGGLPPTPDEAPYTPEDLARAREITPSGYLAGYLTPAGASYAGTGAYDATRDKSLILPNVGRAGLSPKVVADVMGRTYTGPTAPGAGQSDTAAMLDAILRMGRSGTADSNAGKWQAELAFERKKYADEQAAAARQRQALQDYVSSGAYRTGSDELMRMIESMGTRQREDVEGAYNRALDNIAKGYGQAEELTGQGFNALRSYLAQNPNDPYAQLVAASGVTPTAEGQNILSAYGVGAEPVLAQAAAEAEASRQGAAGFQNLIDTLSAAAQQAGTSRMSEAEMAATLAGANLQSQRQGYRTQAEQAQAAALAQIAQRIAEQQFAERQRQIALEEELRRALANAGVAQPTATQPVIPSDIPLSGQFGLVD